MTPDKQDIQIVKGQVTLLLVQLIPLGNTTVRSQCQHALVFWDMGSNINLVRKGLDNEEVWVGYLASL